jgi:uncharacterized protein (TIGR02757 family)
MITIAASSRPAEVSEKSENLKAVLDTLYKKYNRRELIKPDPLQFVYEYSNPTDMEIAGFLAALLAYGRVEQIEKSLRNLLGRMGKSPYEFVVNFKNRDRAKLSGFKHRFNTGDDIADLLTLLQKVISESGGLENYFLRFYNGSDENIIPASSQFCDSLLDMWHGLPARASTARMAVPQGLAFLLAGPNHGGAAKRLNLFLRWMVRKDDVDAGLWRSIDKSKLIIPVDVHIARLCRILGFHNHTNVTLKTALEITRGFAEIEPADPVKYDFALSRIGIVENCTGWRQIYCDDCELLPWCCRRKDW